MKYFFLLSIFFVKLANAQQMCELKFQLIYLNSSEAISDTTFIDIAQTSKKFAINYLEDGIDERFVMDSLAQKVLELMNAPNEKMALVADLSINEGFGFTTAYDFLQKEIIEDNGYRLTGDKKTIQGWDCQKIEFLDYTGVYGTGWVAIGLHIGFSAETGFISVKEGAVIEYSIFDGGNEASITLILVKSSKTIADSATIFSLEIPEGFTMSKMGY